MTQEQFNAALAAVARHHSTTISINSVLTHFVGDIGKTEFSIHITKCCPGLVNDLVKLGYSLGMDERGLKVTKV